MEYVKNGFMNYLTPSMLNAYIYVDKCGFSVGNKVMDGGKQGEESKKRKCPPPLHESLKSSLKFRFVSFFHKLPLFSRLCAMPALKYVYYAAISKSLVFIQPPQEAFG